DADGVGGVVAAGGVGQQRVARQVEEIEDVFAAAVVESLAADGDSDAVGARQSERFLHRLECVVLACADDQAAVGRVRANAERRVGQCVGGRFGDGHLADFTTR